MPVISTRSLTYLYSKGTPFEVAAIKDINIDIDSGELVGIIGHTGSGKSTLIQHLNGILKPEQGTVLLEGKDIWESKASIREARFKVGLCFQYPEYQLFEETVYKDIAFGPKNMKLDEDEIDRRVHRAAEFVGLKEEHLQKSPFDLSGGEKRRAAIAGVMAPYTAADQRIPQQYRQHGFVRFTQHGGYRGSCFKGSGA
jgi:energy-coupling factor transport system ATP-binding protein